MKKLLLLLLLASFATNAQKKTIAITKFERSSGVRLQHVKSIQAKVIEAFQQTDRFIIVDRTSFGKIKEEKELQKSEEFMDGKVVAQSTMQGANAIVSGMVNSVNFSIIRNKRSDGSIYSYYDCKMNISLKVIDVATGQVIASKVLTPERSFMGSILSGSTGTGPQTRQKAFNLTLNRMEKPIRKFVAEYFPITTSIIEISDASSTKAKKLLLNTGETNGSKKGQIFYVYELSKLKAGNKEIIRKIELGKIKITKVEGDEISEAKVLKGGKKILAKFNAGAKIMCYSKN